MLSFLQRNRSLVPGRHFIDILEPVLGSLVSVVMVPSVGVRGRSQQIQGTLSVLRFREPPSAKRCSPVISRL